MPPSCETRHALPELCFQFCRCFLNISPQFLGRCGRTRADAAVAFSVDGDGDAQTHDGPVDKAKLATVPTTLLGSTGRNPEN